MGNFKIWCRAYLDCVLDGMSPADVCLQQKTDNLFSDKTESPICKPLQDDLTRLGVSILK